MTRQPTALLALLISALCAATATSARPQKKIGPDLKVWNRTVDQAIAYLRTHQAEDGT